MIRCLQAADLPAIYEIYTYYVKHSDAIFENEPKSLDAFSQEMMSIAQTYPFYVAVYNDRVIGYAYVHGAFSKECYATCVELTIYFKEGIPHYGLASPLLRAVEERCFQQNVRWIIACITDTNIASIRFHQKHGYRKTGALAECAFKFDRWNGAVWMCKNMNEEKKEYIQLHPSIVKGDVTLKKEASVWYGAVIRGDADSIFIDEQTNVQDNVVIHTDAGYPVHIGKKVTIGHGAIIHGAVIEDEVLIGMGAIIMNGAHIGTHSIIGAGALIPENKEIPANSLVVGSPGKVIRTTSPQQVQDIIDSAAHYVASAKEAEND